MKRAEWTEKEGGLVIGDEEIALSQDKARLILDAHHVALAVEWEAHKADMIRDVEELQGELAGEREKRKQAEAKMFDAYEKAKAMRERLRVSELAAKDNADWFDSLCAELRTILGLAKGEEVTPIIEAVKQVTGDMKRLDWMDENDCGDVLKSFANEVKPIREAIDGVMRGIER